MKDGVRHNTTWTLIKKIRKKTWGVGTKKDEEKAV